MIIQIFSSLHTSSDKIVSDIEFDTFHYPLFKSKSDTDLKELVEETYGLNKLVPKSFSQESKCHFWDSSVKEVKRKLDYSEKSPQSNILDSLKRTQKLSSKGQLVNYFVNHVLISSKQVPVTTSQIVPSMANRYAPLSLLANLNAMPADYSTKIKQFGDDGAYTTSQRIQWFKDFCDLEEVDNDDVKMRLFAQSLKTNVKDWFKGLTAGSITCIEDFYTIFLDRWEEKKNYVQMLTSYNQLKRGIDESIKKLSFRFNSIYNSLPADCKPPEGMAKLHFAEAFDDEFSLFLRERRSQTLAQIMSDDVEVEINMMSSKRGRYKVDPREQQKPKEEPQASTLVDPKFDSLMKVMEKLVYKLSIREKPPARDNVPQIRTLTILRQQDPPPPRIAQRG